jgi:SNF2 family DNA or RNA helicase
MNRVEEKFQNFLEEGNLTSHPHQMYGLKWLMDKEYNRHPVLKKNGGVLADEMGLGKTIMLLGLMAVNKLPSTLIVVPASILNQWKVKITELLGITPVVVAGPRKNSLDLDNEIILTTFGNLNSSSLLEKEYDRLIVDEAHHLKNKNTVAYRSATSIKSKITWLITGTPVQNSLNDLYTLGSLLNLQKHDILMNLEIFKKEAVLHRKKIDANIHLPEKKIFNIEVEWSCDDERSIISALSRRMTRDHLVQMIRQRQMCIVPTMVPKTVCETFNIPEKTFNNILGLTSKIDTVVEKLKSNASNGKRKLVFCHFRKEMDQIVEKMKRSEEYSTKNIVVIDGRMSATDRASAFTTVETDGDVFIMQISTCCEGLNLQMFSEVYFVSPHWNPCVEEQAIGRCHRIGQQEEVHVYRFKMKNSIENYILSTQERKIELRAEMF